ncbi:MAG: DUF3365 domain-containing protein [Desulfuromonadales bacterium]|nr:DUF3365 domain-containing protein [Desulfuromonadales bacterium]
MTSSRTTIWIIAAFLWSGLIAALAWQGLIDSQQTIIDLAEVQARANFNNDNAYQQWAAMHGGVYIPVTDATQPNPFLADIPERDIITPAGKRLTLISHTDISRHIYQILDQKHGVKERITSLNPTRPENSPDRWEEKALNEIETKNEIIHSIDFIRGEKYLRMMFPLHIEADCLKCHTSQDHQVGDQYGGISIAIPFAPFQMAIQSTAVKILMVFFLVWALGLGLIALTCRLIKKQFKTLEEALIKTKTMGIKYQTLFDQAAGGICVTDITTGEIIDCNQSLAELVGRTRLELIGQPQTILFPPSEQKTYEENLEKIWRYKNDDTAHTLEKKLITKGGELIDVQLKAASLEIEGRKLVQGFFYDLSLQKKLYAEAIRSSQLASVGELSAGVAHEINNPIGGVINYAQILLNNNKGDDFERDILNRIIKEGQRIAQIVKSLLSFSRKGENKQYIYDLKKVITEPLILINAHLIKDGITVKLDIMKDLPAIKCDPQQIEQLVLNLVNNSRYALNEKYPGVDTNKRIEISAKVAPFRANKSIQMTFTDYGTGIPAEKLPKIKEAFCTSKPLGKGTGLGLSICEEIVANHGGQFDIESEYGEYTRSTIYLPLQAENN